MAMVVKVGVIIKEKMEVAVKTRMGLNEEGWQWLKKTMGVKVELTVGKRLRVTKEMVVAKGLQAGGRSTIVAVVTVG